MKPTVCHTKGSDCGSDVWVQDVDQLEPICDDGKSDPGQDELVPASQPSPKGTTDELVKGEEDASKHVATARALFDPQDMCLSKSKLTVLRKHKKTMFNPLSSVGPSGYGTSSGWPCSSPCQC